MHEKLQKGWNSDEKWWKEYSERKRWWWYPKNIQQRNIWSVNDGDVGDDKQCKAHKIKYIKIVFQKKLNVPWICILLHLEDSFAQDKLGHQVRDMISISIL